MKSKNSKKSKRASHHQPPLQENLYTTTLKPWESGTQEPERYVQTYNPRLSQPPSPAPNHYHTELHPQAGHPIPGNPIPGDPIPTDGPLYEEIGDKPLKPAPQTHQHNPGQQGPPGRKKSKRGCCIAVVVITILVVLGIAGALFWHFMRSEFAQSNRIDKDDEVTTGRTSTKSVTKSTTPSSVTKTTAGGIPASSTLTSTVGGPSSPMATTPPSSSTPPPGGQLPSTCSTTNRECNSIGSIPGYWCLDGGKFLCRLEADDSLVWIRHEAGTLTFNRTWDDYVMGFGDPAGDYWLGLGALHRVTMETEQTFQLVVELESWTGDKDRVSYSSVSISDHAPEEGKYYQLTLGDFSRGQYTGYNAMTKSQGRGFTTWDRDHDGRSGNCADLYAGGGWWYGNCADTRPTGRYGRRGDRGAPYLLWYQAFGRGDQALKGITMKLKLQDKN